MFNLYTLHGNALFLLPSIHSFPSPPYLSSLLVFFPVPPFPSLILPLVEHDPIPSYLFNCLHHPLIRHHIVYHRHSLHPPLYTSILLASRNPFIIIQPLSFIFLINILPSLFITLSLDLLSGSSSRSPVPIGPPSQPVLALVSP